MGGNEEVEPVKAALDIEQLPGYSKRIVILTDGGTNTKIQNKCFELISRHCENKSSKTRLFAFGIGDNCDAPFVKGMANSGLGSPFIVPERDIGTLNQHVIKALQQSLEPFLSDCKFQVDIPSLNGKSVKPD
jgi:hypothetical protein